MNIFEVATRNKYRFTYRGSLTVEDLWDLNEKDLDSIYKSLKSKAKELSEDSLLETRSTEDTELLNKIEIIKSIFETKRSEALARAEAAVNQKKRKQIEGIIARKQNEALENMSEEDLRKMLAEM